MSRTQAICLAMLMAASPLSAEVYKCTVNGSVTFSDIPCTGDSKPVPMNIFTPSAEEVETANKRTQQIEDNLATSKQQHQIEALRAEVASKQQQMNGDLGRLGSNQAQGESGQTDYIGERSRSAERQSITRRYQNEIEALNKQISTLQKREAKPVATAPSSSGD